jgi:hypothetical protein
MFLDVLRAWMLPSLSLIGQPHANLELQLVFMITGYIKHKPYLSVAYAGSYVSNRASNKITALTDNVYICRSGSVSRSEQLG